MFSVTFKPVYPAKQNHFAARQANPVAFRGEPPEGQAVHDGTGFFPPRYDRQSFLSFVAAAKKQLEKARTHFSIRQEEIEKLNQVPPGEGSVFILNHHDKLGESLLAVMMSHHNRQGRGISTVDNFYAKTGAIFQNSGMLSYDKGKVNADKTNREALKIIEEGEHSLAFFPEGAFSHSFEQVTPLYKGAAQLTLAATRAQKPIWVTPVALVEHMGQNSLPVIGHELSSLEGLLNECRGDVLQMDSAKLQQFKEKHQTAAKASPSPTPEALQRQAERILRVYLTTYQKRFPTEIEDCVTRSLSDTLNEVSDHILNRLAPKYGLADKSSQSTVPKFFKFKTLDDLLDSKIKRNPEAYAEDRQIQRDFADTRLARFCSLLLRTPSMQQHNRIGATPESLFETLMFLRYIGRIRDMVVAPRAASLEVGSPLNVTEWKKTLPPDLSPNKAEELLTSVFHTRLQNTLTKGHDRTNPFQSKL